MVGLQGRRGGECRSAVHSVPEMSLIIGEVSTSLFSFLFFDLDAFASVNYIRIVLKMETNISMFLSYPS